MKHFLISSGIIASALAIGVGMNSQRIMANSEYIKETVRGKQILNTETHTAGNTGMDKESILMWSYGQLETLNLFIPRLMGGGSQEPEGKEMMEKVQQLVQDNVTSQAEYDRISKGFGSLTYWGDQPGTSGPAYQGAIVCFLALLGFFCLKKIPLLDFRSYNSHHIIGLGKQLHATFRLLYRICSVLQQIQSAIFYFGGCGIVISFNCNYRIIQIFQ